MPDAIDALDCIECKYIGQTEAGLALHVHITHQDGGLQKLHLAVDPTDTRAWSTINMDERRIRLRNKNIAQITRNGRQTEFFGPAGLPIEVYLDDFSEIWLVKPSGNEIKICGAHRSTDVTALCCKIAGHQTSHLGVGRCKFHGGNHNRTDSLVASKEIDFLSPFLHQEGHTLQESFNRIAQIGSKDLFNIETLLRTSYGILDHQLREGGEIVICDSCGGEVKVQMGKSDLNGIRATIKTIDRVLRTDADIRSKLVVQPAALWMFVRGLMDQVMPYIRKDERLEVAERIMKNVVLPLGDDATLTMKDSFAGREGAEDVQELLDGLE